MGSPRPGMGFREYCSGTGTKKLLANKKLSVTSPAIRSLAVEPRISSGPGTGRPGKAADRAGPISRVARESACPRADFFARDQCRRRHLPMRRSAEAVAAPYWTDFWPTREPFGNCERSPCRLDRTDKRRFQGRVESGPACGCSRPNYLPRIGQKGPDDGCREQSPHCPFPVSPLREKRPGSMGCSWCVARTECPDAILPPPRLREP